MAFVIIVVVFVYFMCPRYLRLIIFIANLFMPDTIPVLDELIMILGLLPPPSNSGSIEAPKE